MSWLSDLVGGSAGQIIESVGEVADRFIATDKEREELELSKQRLGLEEFQAEVADRTSAREREIKVNESANGAWLGKNISSFLAIGCLTLTFILFYQVLYMDIKAENKDVIIYILGALSSISVQIVGYYFGSSVGSKEKTELLSRTEK